MHPRLNESINQRYNQSVNQSFSHWSIYGFWRSIDWLIDRLIGRLIVLPFLPFSILTPQHVVPFYHFCHFTISAISPSLQAKPFYYDNALTGFTILTILPSYPSYHFALPFYHFYRSNDTTGYIIQSTNRPNKQSIGVSTSESTNASINESTHQPLINESMNQRVNQRISESMNQSTNG